MGGLTGFTWGGCLKIALLKVGGPGRGSGLGTQLVKAAERIGRERGCERVLLDTHGFQAPAFYAALGYTVCGVAEGFPSGHNLYLFETHLR